MISRAAVRSRPEETHQQNLFDAGMLRRRDDASGCFHMYLSIRLRTDFAIDACAVSDGLTIRKCLSQMGRVRKIAGDELCLQACLKGSFSPGHHDNFVAFSDQA